MASITNRSPWGVFTQGSKKALGEFSSHKKAQQFADQWAKAGPVAAVEVRQMESGPWHVRIRRQGFPLVADTFATKRDAKDFVAIKESEMVRREFQDYRNSDKITLKDLLLRYRDEVTKKDPLGDNAEWHRLTKLARHDLAGHSITNLKPSHLTTRCCVPLRLPHKGLLNLFSIQRRVAGATHWAQFRRQNFLWRNGCSRFVQDWRK